MAFVVKRADGRFEIRESEAGAKGPRARTLATFRRLSDDVLDRAATRARHPFDREIVRQRAVALGVAAGAPEATAPARALVGELERGGTVPPAVAAMLIRRLAPMAGVPPDSLDDAAMWLGRSDEDRGRALYDLLLLSDAVSEGKRKSR
jgi:hypothetical protein